jgi:hypothetical protein
MAGVSKHIDLVNLLIKIYDGHSGHTKDCEIHQLRMDNKAPACSCGYDALKKKIDALLEVV